MLNNVDNYNILFMEIWVDFTLFLPKDIIYWHSDGNNPFVILFLNKDIDGSLYFIGKTKIIPYNSVPDVNKYFVLDIILECMDSGKTSINLNREVIDLSNVMQY